MCSAGVGGRLLEMCAVQEFLKYSLRCVQAGVGERLLEICAELAGVGARLETV